MLKFTAAQLTSLGCKTHEEAAEKITGMAATMATQATEITSLRTALTDSVTANTNLQGVVTAQAGEIATLKTTLGNPATLTESRIKEISTAEAKTAGSAAAQAAISGVGMGAPVAAAPAQAATAGTFKTLSDQGKHEEAFAHADNNTKAEFIDAKNYAAFMKAQGAGQVRLNRN